MSTCTDKPTDKINHPNYFHLYFFVIIYENSALFQNNAVKCNFVFFEKISMYTDYFFNNYYKNIAE